MEKSKAKERADPPAKTKREAPPAEPAEEPQYVENLWSGLPNFQCARCPFATLNEAHMRLHVSTAHGK